MTMLTETTPTLRNYLAQLYRSVQANQGLVADLEARISADVDLINQVEAELKDRAAERATTSLVMELCAGTVKEAEAEVKAVTNAVWAEALRRYRYDVTAEQECEAGEWRTLRGTE